MADADDAEDAYALRSPAAGRRDTITRQLQREILGEMAALRAPDDAEEGHTTPETPSKRKTPRLEHEREGKTEEDAPQPSTPSSGRRRTLSPSKAALFQDAEALDAAISRRDTVSPEALKAVLQAAETENRNREQVQMQEKEEHTERRKSSTSDSFTDSMFAPNLLEQDPLRRETLDPTQAASVVAALQMEVRSLNGSALEMDVDSDEDNQQIEQREAKSNAPTPTKEVKKKTLTPTKQVTKKKSPTPSKENGEAPVASESRKSPPPAKAAKSRKSPSPAKEKSPKQTKGRKSPSPAKDKSPKQTKGRKSPTQTKSSSDRRTTVEPSDVLQMLENSSQQEDRRRQTIDANGLLELTRGLESPSSSRNNSARKRKEEASRKRANDTDAGVPSPAKRTRGGIENDEDETMESMEIDSPSQADTKHSSRSPSPKERQKTGSYTQSSTDELPPSKIPKPSLFSPPPGESRIRTPLKGILSARKGRRNPGGAVQTTPSKSVNFGPSQGAEFNHGSPSTSMTPMCAKDALRLFPLDPPEEEPDDAETSLNSSILSEADSIDEDEAKEPVQRVPTVFSPKKSGFDLLQQRRSSLPVPKSTDKSRRRQSLRGYSPLDSQTAARRRRRQTINVTHQDSSKAVLTTKPSFAKPMESSQSPQRGYSFLRVTDATETSLMPYADSSASSDAGEDMEITGDYAVLLARGSEVSRQQQGVSVPSTMPREEDTAEFSLGHLLAESAVYELTKSAPESDLHDLPGSLGDLANEVADVPLSQGSQLADNSQKIADSQDTTLDPIQEVDETMTSSRGQSMMSIDSDESDAEYSASRKSLSVNLSSSFERVSTGGEASEQPPSSPGVLLQLVTMEEVLSSVALAEDNTSVETEEAFFGEVADSSADEVPRNVKLACAYKTCLEVVDRHAGDIASWSRSLTEELSTLLHLKAPAVFSPENLDDAGRDAIRKLYATEVMVASSGWCQLQAQMEKQLADSLSLGSDALAKDVTTLKNSVSSDVLKRQNELSAIKEMIEREEQMGLLLDAIEEQQGAHDEYVDAVKDLEKECASLSLEDSVLQSRLKVLEGRAAELEPVTSAAATRFEQQVLETEEMLAIQESMSVWEILEATSTQLRLSARFEDVLFDVEICVDVHLGSSSTGTASTSIKTNESLKRGKRSTYLPIEGDVVLVLERLLLDPHYISRIADESELGNENDGRLCSKVQILEHFITRSFRLLKELRELSTHFSMRFNEDDSTLWVDFLKFPSTASRVDTEAAQFSVGFSLLPVFPYTDYQTDVQVPHGQISSGDVAKEIELVPRQAPKYFTRVCKRLHESFVR